MYMFRLPEIQEELYKVLQQTESDFAKLPQPPSNNPLGDILRALDNFKKEVSERVEGTPEADGLLQTIRPHTTNFKSKIRETAPNFVPWERNEAHKRALPQASFFSDQEEDENRDRNYNYPTGAATLSSPISKLGARNESEVGPCTATVSDYTPRVAPALLSPISNRGAQGEFREYPCVIPVSDCTPRVAVA